MVQTKLNLLWFILCSSEFRLVWIGKFRSNIKPINYILIYMISIIYIINFILVSNFFSFLFMKMSFDSIPFKITIPFIAFHILFFITLLFMFLHFVFNAISIHQNMIILHKEFLYDYEFQFIIIYLNEWMNESVYNESWLSHFELLK